MRLLSIHLGLTTCTNLCWWRRSPIAIGRLEEGTIIISRDKDAAQLAQDWFRDKETKKAIQDHLFDYGLDEEGVVAEAMRLCMNDLADLEQLVHSNERRRSLAYRDLQFWRETKPSRQALELKALPSM